VTRTASGRRDLRKIRAALSRYRIGGETRHLDDHCLLRLAGHIHLQLLGSDPSFPALKLSRPLGDFYDMRPDPELHGTVSPAEVLQIIEHLSRTSPDGLKALELLAEIYKRRMRFSHVLSTQSIPSPTQLGHRSLLEFGTSPKAISDTLRLRKMLYDIDNRSAQESAYLYMKIMAAALGGRTVSAKTSPILKSGSNHGRRAVDCIAGRRAYDFKARMTEAPSRRARFEDETSFARDCYISGYTPVLLVLNQLPGQRPIETVDAFERYDGEVYIGTDAWDHVRDVAGPLLSAFLDRFVHPRAEAVSREEGPLGQAGAYAILSANHRHLHG